MFACLNNHERIIQEIDILKAVKRIGIIVIFFIIIVAVALWATKYFGLTLQGRLNNNEPVVVDTLEYSSQNAKVSEVPYVIEPFVNGLEIPWSIVFTSSDRMLVTERQGRVRVVINGELQTKPLHTFTQISTQSEEGLMGMTLDPDYKTNKLVYFSYAYPSGKNMFVRVVRMIDENDHFTNQDVIIESIPAAQFHAGSRLKFGPDGKLYITTGDATQKELAQDIDSLAGKILRINSDGSIPTDNPFNNSPIWSYGHRNPQGIDWHPETGILFETEHGPSVFDGPAGGDEVNVIIRGANYGWPVVSHEESREGMIDPKIVFTPAVAPASGLFYKSDLLPQFTNNFFFGGLRGEAIIRVIVSKDNPSQIVAYEKLPNISYGRIREIAEGPDGSIYFATSNRDGRGTPLATDDTIYKISPINR
ncbi:hypothetical protein A2801_03515 [Candidatus Woesebacteria bacterium RIFCSPHIGHO2_01_FULL_41_10]|uniref:Glucose/Sorbosone dehydrogenase domain-containing protein n=1 Tax=Candidatus Woesebacteria bacterium RIFCSPHIGHO2_01_FULL_41_10 TaxID=1802500 RepID=A0A1F7YN35_9BACT|nr:MAG: hypothetical protein A2801_03515 [Candidatus Woesebacteria bacterium RIFCSPHIGHO2_01_FULL_41_10]